MEKVINLLDETKNIRRVMKQGVKQICLIALLVTLSLQCIAQMSKGNVMVSGAIGITGDKQKVKKGTQTTDGPVQSGFELKADGFYFLYNYLALGAGLGYTSSYSRNYTNMPHYTEDKTSQSTFGIKPIVQYYVINSGNFGVFAEAGVELSFGTKEKYEKDLNNIEETTNYSLFSYSFGLSPGMHYFITDKIGLTVYSGFFGYTSLKETQKDPSEDIISITNKPNFSFDLKNVSFGVTIRL